MDKNKKKIELINEAPIIKMECPRPYRTRPQREDRNILGEPLTIRQYSVECVPEIDPKELKKLLKKQKKEQKKKEKAEKKMLNKINRERLLKISKEKFRSKMKTAKEKVQKAREAKKKWKNKRKQNKKKQKKEENITEEELGHRLSEKSIKSGESSDREDSREGSVIQTPTMELMKQLEHPKKRVSSDEDQNQRKSSITKSVKSLKTLESQKDLHQMKLFSIQSQLYQFIPWPKSALTPAGASIRMMTLLEFLESSINYELRNIELQEFEEYRESIKQQMTQPIEKINKHYSKQYYIIQRGTITAIGLFKFFQEIELMHVKYNVVYEIHDAVLTKIRSQYVAGHWEIYKEIMERLLLQAILRLLESPVIARIRKQDYKLLIAAIPNSKKHYKEMTGQDIEILIDCHQYLDKYGAGGLVVYNFKKTIFCNNTMEDRVARIMHEKLSIIRNKIYTGIKR